MKAIRSEGLVEKCNIIAFKGINREEENPIPTPGLYAYTILNNAKLLIKMII